MNTLWIYAALIAIASWPILMTIGTAFAKKSITIGWALVVVALPGQTIVIHYILLYLTKVCN